MNFNKISKILIIASTILIVVYDIFAFVLQPDDGTISFTFWEWSQKYPPVPFAWGVLTGHLFFPPWRLK